MNGPNKWTKIAGLVCHILVAGVMLLACSGKAFGFAPEAIVKQLGEFGLGDKIKLIGFGGMIAAVLLLIPRTWPLGALVVSSYWGGAICIHMAHNESYAIPAVFVILTWAGAMLRSPASAGLAVPSRERIAEPVAA